MPDEKGVTVRLCPIFLMSEPSGHVQRIKHQLLSGHSLMISPAEGMLPPQYAVVEFDASVFSYSDLCARAALLTHLGACVRTGEIVTELGTRTLATEYIDEALDAGYSAYLISQTEDARGIAVAYTLITAIADNT